MIRHIVMFRLKETAEDGLKKVNAEKIKKDLEALPDKIDLIKEYDVGINIKETERSYDIVLISSFDSMEKLQEYSKHPEHVQVLEFINKVRTDIAVVDYEY